MAISWAGTLYIHFWGLLPFNGILSGAKFTLCPSLACSYMYMYIDRFTARHSSTGLQHNCGVVSSRDRAAIPFDIGRSNCLVSYFTHRFFVSGLIFANPHDVVCSEVDYLMGVLICAP